MAGQEEGAMIEEIRENTAFIEQDTATYVQREEVRPFIRMLPSGQLTFGIDGSQWCVLLGGDLQTGVAGFGDSPEAASRDFDKAWLAKLPAGGPQARAVTMLEDRAAVPETVICSSCGLEVTTRSIQPHRHHHDGARICGEWLLNGQTWQFDAGERT